MDWKLSHDVVVNSWIIVQIFTWIAISRRFEAFGTGLIKKFVSHDIIFILLPYISQLYCFDLYSRTLSSMYALRYLPGITYNGRK